MCLSDDSHGVSQVGLNYSSMKGYLTSAGVRDVWHLMPAWAAEYGDRSLGPRDRVVARKVDLWTEDPFWKQLDNSQPKAPP